MSSETFPHHEIFNKKRPETRQNIEIQQGDAEVFIDEEIYQGLVDYCRRVLKDKEEGKIPENRNAKAFGVIIGKKHKGYIEVSDIIPLTRDLRQVEPYKSYMDEMVAKYAKPCPYCHIEDRGWYADPKEVLEVERKTSQKGDILGFFHMHSCPVPNIEMSQVHMLDIALVSENAPGYATVIIDMTSRTPKLRWFIIDEKKNVYECPIKITKKQNEGLEEGEK